MITALKFLFYLTFATLRSSEPVVIEHKMIEEEAAPVEVEIDIDDIKMMEKGEMPEKLKGLQLQEVNPKIEE